MDTTTRNKLSVTQLSDIRDKRVVTPNESISDLTASNINLQSRIDTDVVPSFESQRSNILNQYNKQIEDAKKDKIISVDSKNIMIYNISIILILIIIIYLMFFK